MHFSLFNPLDFNDPVTYAIPGFVLIIVAEFYFYLRKRNKLTKDYLKDASASIGLGLGSLVIDLGTKAVAVGYLLWFYQFRIFDNLGPASVSEFASWAWQKSHIWVWVIALFMQDFAFYWHHRLSHEIRLLWAAHINHHSSTNLNFAVALRQSWLELLYKDMWYIPLALIGIHPLMILTMHQFNLIYQFLTHTEAIRRMPKWFEFIFNTPSHHRVHHSSNIKYLDKNYAGIFIIWDRLLGTFTQEEEQEPCVYGITKNIHTYNLFKITFHELQAIIKDVQNAPNLKSKIQYIFNAPGWSHTGDDQRAKTLQKKLENDVFKN
jgi:sterol desaturase/sphingolipid hydroxylase (fatty acid hydroxylase superfamily)